MLFWIALCLLGAAAVFYLGMAVVLFRYLWWIAKTQPGKVAQVGEETLGFRPSRVQTLYMLIIGALLWPRLIASAQDGTL